MTYSTDPSDLRGRSAGGGLSSSRVLRFLLSAFLLTIVAAILSVGWFAQAARLAPMSAGEWTLEFADEFDVARLNPRHWTTCYWWDDRGCTNKGNDELQWYLPANVSIADGLLRLEARSESAVASEGPFAYTSGMVTSGRYYSEPTTSDRFEFTYGYVEVRARIPYGRGLWPAIWLLPSDHTSNPEIDVMEVLGHAPNVLEMHYHYMQRGRKRALGHDITVADLSQNFHRYGVEWSKGAIVWYLDGAEVWRIDGEAPIPATPMYVLLNLAVGGEWAGKPDAETTFPAAFLIDYVKIWQRSET